MYCEDDLPVTPVIHHNSLNWSPALEIWILSWKQRCGRSNGKFSTNLFYLSAYLEFSKAGPQVNWSNRGQQDKLEISKCSSDSFCFKFYFQQKLLMHAKFFKSLITTKSCQIRVDTKIRTIYLITFHIYANFNVLLPLILWLLSLIVSSVLSIYPPVYVFFVYFKNTVLFNNPKVRLIHCSLK